MKLFSKVVTQLCMFVGTYSEYWTLKIVNFTLDILYFNLKSGKKYNVNRHPIVNFAFYFYEKNSIQFKILLLKPSFSYQRHGT